MCAPHERSLASVQICQQAILSSGHLKDIAYAVKQAYDTKYPGSGKATEGVFHCVVGKNFASKYRDRGGRLITAVLVSSSTCRAQRSCGELSKVRFCNECTK